MTSTLHQAMIDRHRETLKSLHGEVLTTDEATNKYTFTWFLAPYVGVVRKSDGVEGTLQFSHSPRFYFGFEKKK